MYNTFVIPLDTSYNRFFYFSCDLYLPWNQLNLLRPMDCQFFTGLQGLHFMLFVYMQIMITVFLNFSIKMRFVGKG